MKPTNEERRAASMRVRRLVHEKRPTVDEFYKDLVRAVMSTWDYYCPDDLINRLAGLIEPEPERTCRFYDTDHGFEDSVRCNACQMTFNRPWQPFRYCPNCGSKVVGE